MSKPTSPSPLHGKGNNRHVDIRGKDKKIHVKVKNPLGAMAIGESQRSAARKEKGRS